MMGLRKIFTITVFATFCGAIAVTGAEASAVQQSEVQSAQFGKGNKKSTSKKSKRKMRMKKKLRKNWY